MTTGQDTISLDGTFSLIKWQPFVRYSVYINRRSIMKDLTLAEEMVLLAIWKLKDNAYGVTIRKQVSRSTNRIFPYGTLYSVLDKLTKKRMITKIVSAPLPRRGGRSRNYYSILPEGISALKKALHLRKSLWDEKTIAALDKV
jgi:PadR family transcriptional regulator PadR